MAGEMALRSMVVGLGCDKDYAWTRRRISFTSGEQEAACVGSSKMLPHFSLSIQATEKADCWDAALTHGSYCGTFRKNELTGDICQGIDDIYTDDKYTLERNEPITFLLELIFPFLSYLTNFLEADTAKFILHMKGSINQICF